MNPNIAKLKYSIVSGSHRPGPVLCWSLIKSKMPHKTGKTQQPLNTFQAEMMHGPVDPVTGNKGKLGLIPSNMSAMVDLRRSS